MAKKAGIDFSAVVADTYDFTARSGRVYSLRDDIPTDKIMVAGAEIQGNARAFSDIGDKSRDDLLTMIHDTSDDIFLAFLDVVKWSIPDVNVDDLRSDFSREEQIQILLFFMSVAGERYQSQQPSASQTA